MLGLGRSWSGGEDDCFILSGLQRARPTLYLDVLVSFQLSWSFHSRSISVDFLS